MIMDTLGHIGLLIIAVIGVWVIARWAAGLRNADRVTYGEGLLIALVVGQVWFWFVFGVFVLLRRSA